MSHWKGLSAENVFRVLGFEWFEKKVGRIDARTLTSNLKALSSILADRPRWHDLLGDLDEKLSPKQVDGARRGLPPDCARKVRLGRYAFPAAYEFLRVAEIKELWVFPGVGGAASFLKNPVGLV